MSDSKESILEKINLMPDDIDEEQIIQRLYMLTRLEHSRKRCEDEGVVNDDEFTRHFEMKKEQMLRV